MEFTRIRKKHIIDIFTSVASGNDVDEALDVLILLWEKYGRHFCQHTMIPTIDKKTLVYQLYSAIAGNTKTVTSKILKQYKRDFRKSFGNYYVTVTPMGVSLLPQQIELISTITTLLSSGNTVMDVTDDIAHHTGLKITSGDHVYKRSITTDIDTLLNT